METEIRNFCIIAHIDHGKSTLADRLLELTGSITPGENKRVLDRHPISRQRGITIKLAPVTMEYVIGETSYLLNLIDTPGHVDFSYEVERTLAAVEGAIFLVDASQGVQAQSVSYWQKAKKMGLELIPVINKIDLPTARVEETKLEMMELFGFREEEILLISAKTGQGVKELLDRLVRVFPTPRAEKNKPLQALIFDSFYDPHQGVVAAVRLFQGRLKPFDKIRFHHTGAQAVVKKIGVFKVKELEEKPQLTAGQIGFVVTGIKDIRQVRVGDTLSSSAAVKPIEGFKHPSSLVFVSFYPTDSDQFPKLKEAIKKLSLIDAALQWRLEHSPILGGGIRLGLLGLLHSQITKERLELDYGLSLVTTMPSIRYRFQTKKGEWQEVDTAAALPAVSEIKTIEEPYIRFTLFSQRRYYGKLFQLLLDSRAEVKEVRYFGQRLELAGSMPLAELISDFFNKLEEATSGFVSFDWQWAGWQPTELSKLELLVNGQVVEGLVFLFPKEKALFRARQLTDKLADIIPRQQFEVIIQGRLNGKIVARRRIPPFRKDVTAKLYGGDQTRKDKLLEKQKKGKKKLKNIGRVHLPEEAFVDLFK